MSDKSPKHEWKTAWRADPSVKPLTRCVLYTLADHMTSHGDSCFPTVDQIQYETGMARATVIKHLKIAFDSGWIQKRSGHAKYGQRWKNNEYRPSIPDGAKAIPWEKSEAYKNKKYSAKQDDGWGKAGSNEREAGSNETEKAGSIQHEAGSFQNKAGSNEVVSWFNSDNKLVQSVDPSSSISNTSSISNSISNSTALSKANFEARCGDSEFYSQFLGLYPKSPTNKPKCKEQWFKDRGGWTCNSIAVQIFDALQDQLKNCHEFSIHKYILKPEKYLEQECWKNKIVQKINQPDRLENTQERAKRLNEEYQSQHSVIEGALS